MALPLDQNDPLVIEGVQMFNDLTSHTFVVGADSGDGELASSAKKCEDWTDFQGLYLVIEQPDGRLLDEHDQPDGNLYKMEGGHR